MSNILNTIEKILREDLENSREMQENCRTQIERLIWQNKIMHTLDLRDRIRRECAEEK